MKIIIVCGSLRFRDEMIKITEKMELKGSVTISVVCLSNLEERLNKEIIYYTDIKDRI